MANPRIHSTTQRVVNETIADEKPALRPLPLAPYRTVLELERRVSHEGMVSVGGNLYSVPDTTFLIVDRDFLYLPAYAPEHDPDEYLNNDLK